MTARYATFAPRLVAAGFDVTPVRGKRAFLEGWAGRPAAALDYAAHADCSIGVLCGGEKNIVAVDVDVLNPFCANELQRLVEDELGFGPRRIGRAPKFLMVFRCTDNVRKLRTGVYTIDGDDSAVEVLAEGQQFVASGVHPDTGQSYAWPDDALIDLTPEDLTEITPAQLQSFMAAASQVLARYGLLKGRVSERSAPAAGGLMLKELDGELAEVQAALAYIPNNDEHYDDWVATLHALKGAVGEDGRELAHMWSQRSAKYDAAETDRCWDSIGRVRNIGAGSLFHWAREYGFDVRDVRREQRVGPEDIAVEPGEPAAVAGGLLRASDITGPLPERRWLLDQWFPAGAVSMLFGQGGVGKTLLTQQLANCVATGVPFMGIATRRMPVLAVLCEDDALEISRRQLDINEWLGVNEVVGRGPRDLFIWPRVGEDNILVTFPSQGEALAGKFYEELTEQLRAVKGDAEEVLLVLDTAADLFGGNENVRREVNTFIKTYLGAFCAHLGATVIVLAHPSLSGLSSGSGLSGSTAWENSARARAYFHRPEDGVDDNLRVLTRKKSNYSVSGSSTDVTLIWDAGVYQLPTSPDQVDRIEQRALKKRICEAIDNAQKDGAPFRPKSGRKIRDTLPVLLGEQRKVVLHALQSLELEGAVVCDSRGGYRCADARWGS